MSEDEPKAILGDLETLRSLLVDDDDVPPSTKRTPDKVKSQRSTDDLFAAQEETRDTAQDDMDVPVLDDVVDGALEVDEGMLAMHDHLESSEGDHILDDDAIKALLSDDWQSAALDVLDNARQQIQESQTEWSPVDTDELNQALKVRIDATVSDWIRTTVVKHMGELRSQLLAAVQDEVTQQIVATLNQPGAPTNEPTHPTAGNEDSG